MHDLYRNSPRQFDALLARLHQQSILIFTTIVLVIQNQRLSLFNDLRRVLANRGVFFRMTLPRWHTRTFDYSNLWTILKPYILLQCHKWLISSIQRTELFSLLSVQREGLRSTFDYTPHLVSTSRPFWQYDCLLQASSFLERQQFLAEAQYSEKFKLKFVRILVTHSVQSYIICIYR